MVIPWWVGDVHAKARGMPRAVIPANAGIQVDYLIVFAGKFPLRTGFPPARERRWRQKQMFLIYKAV
jgi:hypothetical protein